MLFRLILTRPEPRGHGDRNRNGAPHDRPWVENRADKKNRDGNSAQEGPDACARLCRPVIRRGVEHTRDERLRRVRRETFYMPGDSALFPKRLTTAHNGDACEVVRWRR